MRWSTGAKQRVRDRGKEGRARETHRGRESETVKQRTWLRDWERWSAGAKERVWLRIAKTVGKGGR